MKDKMIRMAGRGTDGNAKALKTNNNGNLEVNFNDSIVGYREVFLQATETIAPASTYSTGEYTDAGNVTGINLRLSSSANVIITINHRADNGRIVSVEEIYGANDGENAYIAVSTERKSKRFNLTIRNLNDTNVVMTDLVITSYVGAPNPKLGLERLHRDMRGMWDIPRESAVNVGVSQTLLPQNFRKNRTELIIYNNGNETVYLGSSNVTVNNGLPLPVGAERTIRLDRDSIRIFAVSHTGNQDVRIWEVV